jgi:hypothetical protein
VVAELLRDGGGEVIGTNGYYVDVTFPPEERESFISDAVAEIAANRAVIEQVKGILMMVYRVDADAAFDLLKWRSQEANIKLRLLAEQLLSDFQALNYEDTLPARAVFDQLLLTVQNRVAVMRHRRRASLGQQVGRHLDDADCIGGPTASRCHRNAHAARAPAPISCPAVKLRWGSAGSAPSAASTSSSRTPD